jgi:hypothetical protein
MLADPSPDTLDALGTLVNTGGNGVTRLASQDGELILSMESECFADYFGVIVNEGLYVVYDCGA